METGGQGPGAPPAGLRSLCGWLETEAMGAALVGAVYAGLAGGPAAYTLHPRDINRAVEGR